MRALIVYGSRYGNTRELAEAMAAAARITAEADVRDAGAGALVLPAQPDLLVVGGPTEGHRMTPEIRDFLDGLPHAALRGVEVAAFDTRLDWPGWLAGSAAVGIAKRLKAHGGRLIVPPESFLVANLPKDAPGRDARPCAFLPGEVERGVAWMQEVLAKMGAAVPALR